MRLNSSRSGRRERTVERLFDERVVAVAFAVVVVVAVALVLAVLI